MTIHVLTKGAGMASELEVDARGLRGAAASSENAAATLSVGEEPRASESSQPSGGGVNAVNAALAAARTRQSQRINRQANDLRISSARYEATDAAGAGAIATVSV